MEEEIYKMSSDALRAELRERLAWIETAKKGGFEYDVDEYFVFLVRRCRPNIYIDVVGSLD